eukprot:TRINITY_DN394_c0_g2_i3.p1 TRINITY_DN394_c0_g2~~TRINITY_DN394_c0_g2_i3.p1  ORF type:complete len:676 (-),score=168.58 TRINITY_DN394_c0_g2_i3:1176-3203(-)
MSTAKLDDLIQGFAELFTLQCDRAKELVRGYEAKSVSDVMNASELEFKEKSFLSSLKFEQLKLEFEEKLKEKDKRLEEKDKTLEEKDKTLEEKDKRLEEKDKTIEKKDRKLVEFKYLSGVFIHTTATELCKDFSIFEFPGHDDELQTINDSECVKIAQEHYRNSMDKGDKIESKPESEIQSIMNTVFEDLKPLFEKSMKYVDTSSAHHGLGGAQHRVDCSFISAKSCVVSLHDVVTMGALKASTPQHQNLQSAAKQLLERCIQVYWIKGREDFYGFVSNGLHIRFVHFMFKSGEIPKLMWTEKYDMLGDDSGLLRLAYFLKQGLSNFGFSATKTSCGSVGESVSMIVSSAGESAQTVVREKELSIQGIIQANWMENDMPSSRLQHRQKEEVLVVKDVKSEEYFVLKAFHDRERMEREVDILHQIHDIKHVAKFVCSGFVMGVADTVQVYVFLQKYFEHHVWTTEEIQGTVPEILSKLLPVINDLNKRGIVHGDISPKNLIWDRNERVFHLIDFGEATNVTGVKNLLDGAVVGTFPFMHPSQTEGVHTASLDIFGLFVSILRMVTEDDWHPMKDFKDMSNVSAVYAEIVKNRNKSIQKIVNVDDGDEKWKVVMKYFFRCWRQHLWNGQMPNWNGFLHDMKVVCSDAPLSLHALSEDVQNCTFNVEDEIGPEKYQQF